MQVPDGPCSVEAAYVVGCDSARSTVPTAAGIDFPRTDAVKWGWLADVRLDDPPDERTLSVALRSVPSDLIDTASDFSRALAERDRALAQRGTGPDVPGWNEVQRLLVRPDGHAAGIDQAAPELW